jgi:hypothetical protein
MEAKHGGRFKHTVLYIRAGDFASIFFRTCLKKVEASGVEVTDLGSVQTKGFIGRFENNRDLQRKSGSGEAHFGKKITQKRRQENLN